MLIDVQGMHLTAENMYMIVFLLITTCRKLLPVSCCSVPLKRIRAGCLAVVFSRFDSFDLLTIADILLSLSYLGANLGCVSVSLR